MTNKEVFSSLEEEVSNIYVERLHGHWTAADQAALETRLANDPEYAQAYRLAEQSALALKSTAEMPEMMRFREQAIAHARRSSAQRWLGPSRRRALWWSVAAGLAGVVALGVTWQLSPWGYRSGEYHTEIGEQRIVELSDHSRVTLDAKTLLSIHYTDTGRTVELREGQAQFSVTHDAARPFTVKAGDRTILALGTVFTVDYSAERVNVVLLDGRLAIEGGEPPRARSAQSAQGTQGHTIELSSGEELQVARDGKTTVIPKADLEVATAWRKGKVILRDERLADAIQRVNRYSHVQLEIDDPGLADEAVSGVFEAGDTQGFITGVQLALPVIAESLNSRRIKLRYR